MIRKIVIEKAYLLLVIVAMGLYCGLQILTTEHGSALQETSDDNPYVKLITGFFFMLIFAYMLFQWRSWRFNKIGWVLLALAVVMAVMRIIDLPYRVGIVSYIYQPMRDLLLIVTFCGAYALASKSDELSDFFATSSLVAFLITTFVYWKNYQYMNMLGDGYASIGTSYYVLFLLPIVMLNPHKWVRYLAVVLTALVVLSSMKRGGTIALFAALIVYEFVKQILTSNRKFTGLIIMSMALLFLFVGFVVYDNMTDNWLSERLMNVEEDRGSGRVDVWEETFRLIQNNDLETWLVGNGHNAVLRDSRLGFSAHNDFLEILYDYGMVIFFFYLSLHLILIKNMLRFIRIKSSYAPILAFSYTMFFILSMISHVIIFPWFCICTMLWGMVLGGERRIEQLL